MTEVAGRAEDADKELLAHRAYDIIKAQIVTFELRPGSVVIASEFAGRLGMSVTPVHDALKRLCVEGLAQSIPRIGYMIAPITLTDVQEIFGLRLALESHAIDLGMRRLDDNAAEAFRASVYADPPAVGELGRPPAKWERLVVIGERHDDFHLAVASLSGNGRLVRMIRELLDQGRRLTMLRAWSTGPDAVERLMPGRSSGHQVIAEAVLARDHQAAVAAMAYHVRVQHRLLVEELASLPADSFGAGGALPVLDEGVPAEGIRVPDQGGAIRPRPQKG